ncbi:SCO6745 family protein [Saccharopolyspora hattusasensis]|uniref:SCO6745 family protein n=1 Tax=Saccharopolyspora hattusasensis TaxID=1128679 RepID=UPI003D954555
MNTKLVDLPPTREAHQVLDPFHGVTYLATQSVQAFHAIGLTGPWDGYFGGRAAPLGPVGPAVVSAVFYHFKPSMVAAEMTGLWEKATPTQALHARLTGVDAALRALLDGVLTERRVAEAAELAVAGATACSVPARPLGAANQALDLPDEPHLALWQAVTTLREFRGDGHAAALAEARLGGVEALITATASGIERRASIQASRGWTDTEWAAGEHRLTQQGLLAADGSLTKLGSETRQAVEQRTDQLAEVPWRALGVTATNRLLELMRPLTAQVVSGLRSASKRAGRNG